MLRRLFTIVSAISFLLSVAICIMWIRSYRVAETFGFNCDVERKPSYTDAKGTLWISSCRYRSTELETGGGDLALASAFVGDFGHVKAWTLDRRWTYHTLPQPLFFFSNPTFGGRWSFEFHARYWILFIFMLICPMLWIILARRARKKQRETSALTCAQCGYDLRATPHRCPECGAIGKPQSVLEGKVEISSPGI